MVSNFGVHQNHPERLLKYRFLGLTQSFWGWAQKISFLKLPGDANAAAAGNILRELLIYNNPFAIN